MRVGADGFTHEGSPHHSRQERREAFKRTHRPGDRVRARFLAWEITPGDAESPGLAWVQVDGHPLRAPLRGSMAPGDCFLLQVDALTPEILLSMIEGEPLAANVSADEDRALRPRLHITV